MHYAIGSLHRLPRAMCSTQRVALPSPNIITRNLVQWNLSNPKSLGPEAEGVQISEMLW